MDNMKGRILLKQQISNLKEVGFEDIERTVNVMQAHIDGGNYEQFYVNYFILYTRYGVDVSHLFKNQTSYDWYINNSEMIQQRDENFEPVLDAEGNFILLPAFDYIMGVFDNLNAISYDVLKAYIVENDNDGKWDLTE
ncbi:hypothetical protein [Empedobacter sp. GD03797]|uniref:hypothetical protein n=1 Tax=Empedobacter sp. GD03797 TaxID=2975382 RepID=UPI00244A5E95|nr:hypothetical protein [Empedobacter sp. GD03797]MDH1882769.1 hypothetical protein [Empedobacter sp. GD03797]